MLNGRGQGDGNNEKNGFQGKFRKGEGGQGQPGRGQYFVPAAHAQPEGRAETHGNAAENGHQAQKAPAQQGNQHRGRQGGHGDDHGRIFRHELLRAVAALAQGHVHGHGREHKADDHNHRAGDDGRQQAQNDAHAPPADQQAQKDVDQTGAEQPAQRQGHAPGLRAVNDGRDEGKGRGQKNRHLAARADLKDQGAHTGREQGHIAVQAGEQRHQHQRAEGHKKHLRAQQAIPQAQIIGRVHAAVLPAVRMHAPAPGYGSPQRPGLGKPLRSTWCRKCGPRRRPGPE